VPILNILGYNGIIRLKVAPMPNNRRLTKPIDLSLSNQAKAKGLYNKYEWYMLKAYAKRMNDLHYHDREDLLSFIRQRFWLSCLRADPEKCSSYLYQTARLAALKHTAKTIKQYQLKRKEKKCD
jgi:hypothetical protein